MNESLPGKLPSRYRFQFQFWRSIRKRPSSNMAWNTTSPTWTSTGGSGWAVRSSQIPRFLSRFFVFRIWWRRRIYLVRFQLLVRLFFFFFLLQDKFSFDSEKYKNPFQTNYNYKPHPNQPLHLNRPQKSNLLWKFRNCGVSSMIVP